MAATARVPDQPLHQHPNPNGTPKGTGQALPWIRREDWQLLADESALDARIKKEAERCQPDLELIQSLKTKRLAVRMEMKGQPSPQKR